MVVGGQEVLREQPLRAARVDEATHRDEHDRGARGRLGPCRSRNDRALMGPARWPSWCFSEAEPPLNDCRRGFRPCPGQRPRRRGDSADRRRPAGHTRSIASIARSTRFTDTGYAVPSVCANSETRSSSSIQPMATTSSDARRAGRSDSSRLGVGVLASEDLARWLACPGPGRRGRGRAGAARRAGTGPGRAAGRKPASATNPGRTSSRSWARTSATQRPAASAPSCASSRRAASRSLAQDRLDQADDLHHPGRVGCAPRRAPPRSPPRAPDLLAGSRSISDRVDGAGEAVVEQRRHASRAGCGRAPASGVGEPGQDLLHGGGDVEQRAAGARRAGARRSPRRGSAARAATRRVARRRRARGSPGPGARRRGRGDSSGHLAERHASQPDRSTAAPARPTCRRSSRRGCVAQRVEVLALGDHRPVRPRPEGHPQVRRHPRDVPVLRATATPASSRSTAAERVGEQLVRGPGRARAAARRAAACSGAGTKLRRIALGSARISAVTRSSRKPGHLPVEPVGGHAVEHGRPGRAR